jgi:DNA invertase Pin-like site-specific DNA recombinase
MKRAWLYSRYSTAGQNETSIERQELSAKIWCESNGYELLGNYADRAQSGAIPFMERPALKELFDSPDLLAGDLILIEKLDRITRGGELERMRIHLYFVDRKIGLHLVDSNRDALTLDIGSYISTVVDSSTDKSKKDEAVKRSIEGKRLKMKQAIESGGKRVSGVCPPWLVLSEDKCSFLPIEDRVNTIHHIFKLAESLGATRICNELNESGVNGFASTKKNPKWKKGCDLPKFLNIKVSSWQAFQVKNILKDRRLLGELSTSHFGIVKDYYPTIINETDLILASSNLESRRGKTSPSLKSFKNIFTGVAKCVNCKSPIHYSSKGNGYNYLICSSGCEKSKPMRYEKFESSFMKWAVEIDWNKFMNEKSNTIEVKSSIAKNSKLQDELEVQINNLVDNLAEGLNVRIVAKIDTLEDNLTVLKAEGKRLNLLMKAELVKEANLNELDLSWAKDLINQGDVKLRAKLNSQLTDRLDSLYFSLSNSPRPYFATLINGRKQVVFVLDDKSYEIGYEEDLY